MIRIKTSFFFVVALMALCCIQLLAQPTNNRVAVVNIYDVKVESGDTLTFTVGLARLDESWLRYANSTFQFELTPAPDYSNLRIELVPGTSELDGGYIISPRVVTQGNPPGPSFSKPRLSVNILGPQQFAGAKVVTSDTLNTSILGTFRVISVNGTDFSQNAGVLWADPLEYYQALAYKRGSDSIPFNGNDDNIEIGFRTTFNSPTRRDTSQVLTCQARYLNVRRVAVNWNMVRERNNAGFIVLRGILPFGELDPSIVEYRDTVASYRTNPDLVGQGTSNTQKSYSIIDTVPLRGEEYYYKILSFNSDGRSVDTCIVSVRIPYAVIVEADASPNPMTDRTTVRFKVDDDVILSMKVFDLGGRLVETLIDNQYTPLGSYNRVWEASRYASQGLYNIFLFARPVDDPTVEDSRAVVKVQIVR